VLCTIGSTTCQCYCLRRVPRRTLHLQATWWSTRHYPCLLCWLYHRYPGWGYDRICPHSSRWVEGPTCWITKSEQAWIDHHYRQSLHPHRHSVHLVTNLPVAMLLLHGHVSLKNSTARWVVWRRKRKRTEGGLVKIPRLLAESSHIRFHRLVEGPRNHSQVRGPIS
jgi:hypothetical protein